MTDEEIIALDTEWTEILNYLYGKLSRDRIDVLIAAVNYPAMPENRAQLLNTCGIYPPETITPLEAKRMMIDEWKKRRAEEPVPEPPLAWGNRAQHRTLAQRVEDRRQEIREQRLRVRRNAMRRTAPAFELPGGVLIRDKITTRKRTDRLKKENPPITPTMMATAVRSAIQHHPEHENLMYWVLKSLANHIHYDVPTMYDAMEFVTATEGEWDDRSVKSAPYFSWSAESLTQLREYLRVHGGVEIRELIREEDARLANQPPPEIVQEHEEEGA